MYSSSLVTNLGNSSIWVGLWTFELCVHEQFDDLIRNTILTVVWHVTQKNGFACSRNYANGCNIRGTIQNALASDPFPLHPWQPCKFRKITCESSWLALSLTVPHEAKQSASSLSTIEHPTAPNHCTRVPDIRDTISKTEIAHSPFSRSEMDGNGLPRDRCTFARAFPVRKERQIPKPWCVFPGS